MKDLVYDIIYHFMVFDTLVYGRLRLIQCILTNINVVVKRFNVQFFRTLDVGFFNDRCYWNLYPEKW